MGNRHCQGFPSAQTCPESLQGWRGFVSFHVLSTVMGLQPICHALNKPRKPPVQYEKEEADPLPDLIDAPAVPLHWELPRAPCVGARLWRCSQRWGAGRGGFPLVFQAVFVKIGHGRLHLLLPRLFCGSLGRQRARSREGEHSPVCCTPRAEHTPLSVHPDKCTGLPLTCSSARLPLAKSSELGSLGQAGGQE